MAIYFEIIEGPNAGSRFRVYPGSRIGRAEGDILLKDSKVSGIHAQVEAGPQGVLYLVDKDSSNGVKVNGKKIKRLELSRGVVFQVGRTYLRVTDSADLAAQPGGQKKGRDEGGHTPAPAQSEEGDWRHYLEFWVPQIQTQNSPDAGSLVRAFELPLKLSFLEGPLVGREVFVGYGPREVGSDTLDIELLDENVPPVAFVLRPEGGRARLETQFSHVVKVNDRNATSELLDEGDIIKVGKSVLRVSFLQPLKPEAPEF